MRRPLPSPLSSSPFPLTLTLALGLSLSLCASCDDGEPEPFEPLDPTQVQYGKTLAEWAADWVNFSFSYQPPMCQDPIKDPTGAACANGQDPASPVFFLVGTFGGPAVRTECVVPADVALLFPLVNVYGDNAGLPADKVPTDAQIKEYIETQAQGIVEDSFYATVDGRPVQNLQAGFSRMAVPYTVHIPEGPNSYTCAGVEGVSGDFGGYILGAWVMLPPLGPGEHTITFGSAVRAAAPEPAFTTDVRYELTVAEATPR